VDDSPLVLGVEGDGVTPSAFDVAQTLAFLNSFVDLICSIAGVSQEELVLTSLQIEKGSVQFPIGSNNPMLARKCAQQAYSMLSGGENSKHGLVAKVSRARDALGRLPETYRPFLQAGKKRRTLPRTFTRPEEYSEVTSLRGELIKAGGVDPRVWLKAEEEGHLSLRTSKELAERAGHTLYQLIDAVVLLVREGDRIVDAELYEYELVENLTPEDEKKRWRSWFHEAGSDWEEIEDIESELGRGRIS